MDWITVRLLAIGALATAGISLIAILLGLAIGMLICVASLSRNPVLRGFGRLYISFFRGSPLLVQLLLI